MKRNFTHFKIKEPEKPKRKEYTAMEMENFKQQVEQFRKALNEKMRDPNLAKKAAHLLSMWIAGEKITSAPKDESKSNLGPTKKKKAA